jgi:hypothetical protein
MYPNLASVVTSQSWKKMNKLYNGWVGSVRSFISYLNPDKSDNGKAYMLVLVPMNYLLTKLGLQALQEHDMYKSLQ